MQVAKGGDSNDLLGLSHTSVVEQTAFRPGSLELGSMARGFDSKFVEAQQEEAIRDKPSRPTLSPEQKALEARRQSILLSRTRAQAELDRATAPAHRRMLEGAITALDDQLKTLDMPSRDL